MIPFKVQFDKLTAAYINDRVNPYVGCACFIGNLLNGEDWWNCRLYVQYGRSRLRDVGSFILVAASQKISKQSEGFYEPIDVLILENKFLRILEQETVGDKHGSFYMSTIVLDHPNYEEALFKAFSGTLDLLKRIHEGKGEKVEEFTFTKRKKYSPLVEKALR